VIGRFPLEGRHVRLEPLEMAHADALLAASNEDRATYSFTRTPNGPAGVVAYIDEALADERRGARVPFATWWRDEERFVGSTSFFPEWWEWEHRSEQPDVAEIGATWLAASAQRTAVNTEAKYLMLTHAFEVWGVVRVSLKTDSRNERSRAAIERLGAHYDGTLRRQMPAFGPGGGPRDSAFFSILAEEWPAAKARLESLLRAY
jgi:RimJ/RimL family protein N-acetyltransferase